jgi:Flp pilus assembly protein TadD
MCFDRAVEHAPGNEEFWLGRAGMLKKIGILRGRKRTVEAAGRAFLRLVESNPNHAKALHGLACCMKGTGNDRTARRFFDRAQEMMDRGANTPETEAPRFTGLI